MELRLVRAIFKSMVVFGLCGLAHLAIQPGSAGAQTNNLPSAIVTVPALGQVRVSGATVYDAENAVMYATGYIREHHGIMNIPAIAAAIQYLYREHGYFLAEVLVGSDSSGNNNHIIIDEGVISRIEVFGAEASISRRVASYFQHLADGNPVTKAEFERALMLASDLSGVVVRSEVRPDGEGRRVVALHVNATSHRVMGIADYGPRQDMASVNLVGEAYSQLTSGDMIRVAIGGSRHVDASNHGLNIAAAYRFPIGNDGTYGEFLAANTRYGRNISGDLSDSRFQEGKNFIALIGHPFVRNIHEFLYGFLEYDYADLDAGPASLGNDTSQSMRLSLYYSSVGHAHGAFRAGITLTGGVADTQGVGRSDDQFWHLRAGAGLVVHLDPPNGDYSLRIEGLAQMTNAALPATEQFYLGDRDRMRGYNIAAAAGDSGFAGTVELSRYITVGEGLFAAISPSIFFDVGMIRNNAPHLAQYGSRTLSSVGAATRLFLRDNFTLSGWIALPLAEDGRDSYLSPAAYVRLTKVW